MPGCLSTTVCSPFFGSPGQSRQTASRPKSQRELRIARSNDNRLKSILVYRSVSKPPNAPIHNLDDDSLLSIFHLCRPNLLEEDEYNDVWWVDWVQGRWWYQLVKVCRRWRYLVLGSASHLGLCLICTRGTPVADMLAHSPPLPLIIHHGDKNHELTAEEEEGIMFALQHRDRVRYIYLEKPVLISQKLIKAMDNQFPMLEYLHIVPPTGQGAPLVLPSTFEAPQLRILVLKHVAFPIGSPLLTTAICLVRLSLRWVHPLTNLYPDHLFQALSHLPQLQNLIITIITFSPVPNPEIETQLLRMPIITHITLPSLRTFTFRGVSAYLEPLLSHVKAPLLDVLNFTFLNQLRFSVPHLSQFVMTAVNLRSSRVKFLFYHQAIAAFMHRSVSAYSPTLVFHLGCDHRDWQVSSMAQMFNVLSSFCSTVVDLTLDYRSHALSSESHNQADRNQWRELLGSFRNVETIRVHDGLVGELSRCLALDGQPTSEILPKLKTLVCPMGSRDDKRFATFVHNREVAGLPIDIIEDVFPAGKMKYRLLRTAGVVYVS